MPTPKFHPGQIVAYHQLARYRDAAPGAYEITKQLPERDGEFEYQIKSLNEPHQRVARESELRLA